MYIKIKDLDIYYQKTGQGKNLILLHGWKHDVSTWWGVVDGLKDDFTVWMVDLPGHGRSELGEKDLTVQDFSQIIEEFISKLKISNPHLVGHSFGGNIAIHMAAVPNQIDKLILVGSSGIREKQLKNIFLKWASKIFNMTVPNIFGFKEALRRQFYKKIEGDYLESGKLRGTIKNIFKDDVREILPKINNETLLLWGEKDRAVRLAFGKLMYQLIPNSRIEVIENAGHNVHHHNEKQFVYWVRNFLLN